MENENNAKRQPFRGVTLSLEPVTLDRETMDALVDAVTSPIFRMLDEVRKDLMENLELQMKSRLGEPEPVEAVEIEPEPVEAEITKPGVEQTGPVEIVAGHRGSTRSVMDVLRALLSDVNQAVFTPEQVQRVLGRHVSEVYRLGKDGAFEYVKGQSRRRISPESLAKFINGRNPRSEWFRKLFWSRWPVKTSVEIPVAGWESRKLSKLRRPKGSGK